MTPSRSDPDYYPQIKIDGETYLIADDLGDSCRHCAFFDRFGLLNGDPDNTGHCIRMAVPEQGRELFERHDCETSATVFLNPKNLESYVAISVTRRMER
jgi:hypothetical protein